MDPTFFATPDAFRAWLEAHQETATALWVGFHKKGSGRPSITWPETVDEALCVGWIDGVRKGIDEASYAIRFTPRKPGSTWSAVNIARVAELTALGRMLPAGLAAFEARSPERSATYAYEQATVALDAAAERAFRANPDAWTFFQAQPPSYRKAATWWVASAKKEETRRKRLAALIDDSAHGRTVPPFTRHSKRS
ncbi:MAG: YdeI/OmpD-associated family protein [Chloroflexota bacterium]|nr:YdeI/OmpD-associated family protein [Chloroflexota bacterium]